jgi:hypothetical protein
MFPAQRSSKCRSKLTAPESNGFARHRDTRLGKQILDIALAESERVAEPDGTADDFGREPVTCLYVDFIRPLSLKFA